MFSLTTGRLDVDTPMHGGIDPWAMVTHSQPS
jgi:hypothetical protein